MTVLERVNHRKARLRTDEHGRIAVAVMQVDQQDLALLVPAKVAAVFTASVVVPTPPLAPTNANTWQAVDPVSLMTRRSAASRAWLVSGSTTHSDDAGAHRFEHQLADRATT